MQKQRITDNGDRAVVSEGHGLSGFAAVKAEVHVDQ
jgi:hypothetical protein